MYEFEQPRVVVGVDGSLSGLAAIRIAVAEARSRSVPLVGVRSRTSGATSVDRAAMYSAFLEALGAMPDGLDLDLRVSPLRIADALCAAARDLRDVIVVGAGDKGAWHSFWFGSVAHSVARRARCAVFAVPPPEMARTVRRPYRRRGFDQWDPLRDLETTRSAQRGQRYSGI